MSEANCRSCVTGLFSGFSKKQKNCIRNWEIPTNLRLERYRKIAKEIVNRGLPVKAAKNEVAVSGIVPRKDR